jgi:hypothetical protein
MWFNIINQTAAVLGRWHAPHPLRKPLAVASYTVFYHFRRMLL